MRRAACLAYRRTRQSGKLDPPAHLAAVHTFLLVIPEMPRSEASSQVQQGIYGPRLSTRNGFGGVRGAPGAPLNGQTPCRGRTCQEFRLSDIQDVKLRSCLVWRPS